MTFVKTLNKKSVFWWFEKLTSPIQLLPLVGHRASGPESLPCQTWSNNPLKISWQKVSRNRRNNKIPWIRWTFLFWRNFQTGKGFWSFSFLSMMGKECPQRDKYILGGRLGWLWKWKLKLTVKMKTKSNCESENWKWKWKGRSHRIGKADGADSVRKHDWFLKEKKTWVWNLFKCVSIPSTYSRT